MRWRQASVVAGLASLLVLVAASPVRADEAAGASGDASEGLSREQQWELDALRETLRRAPYSALVVHTRLEIFPLPEGRPSGDLREERHVYHARVLETFRGPVYRNIRYTMVVERGEEAPLESGPMIVMLCRGAAGLYWPGVGTSFPGEQRLVTEARHVSRQLPRRWHPDGILCPGAVAPARPAGGFARQEWAVVH